VGLKGEDKECKIEQVGLAVIFSPVFRGCLIRISAVTSTILIDVFHGFSQSLRANSGIVPGLGHDHFLPDSLQFISYDSSYHLMLYSILVDTVTAIK
jgi:hypothetical protein